jgi:hypothetical protein
MGISHSRTFSIGPLALEGSCETVVLGGEDSGALALIKLMPILLEKPVDYLGLLTRVLSSPLSDDCTFAIRNPLALLRNERRGGRI